ncbi:hypothetical protein [Actinacidiphila sp. ITFR-21]|uniref:hypothetical protein n=1 Tax=Actinacidiphila sp. ITFR-21 TaxID=3075199 RepID=UPI00288BDBF9|nr:hypothetical protein [Streptomyces sp. ITFR-21]WNI19173.1 hypothetical protein RLT57_28960 [Streptomyces sp. ITFR-21]
MASIEPLMGPESYKSYVISQPLATHWRRATCEEVGCDKFANGWRVRVEGLPAEQLNAVRNSGRSYQELRVADGETYLDFAAGQPCFSTTQHRAPLGKAPLYLVRDGDTRGNPRGTRARLHQRPDFWVEDFAEHQQTLADAQRQG